MDWSKGLSASYKAFLVDPVTWSNTEEIEIVSGSISKSEDSLRESADITVHNYDNNREQWIRVYLDARQSSDSYYGPIFTGLISSPAKDIEGNTQINNLKCYSVLKPANDVLLPKGYYISYGTNSATVLRSLLSVMKAIPIEIISDPEDPIPNVSQTLIAESGETRLSMADKILYSIGCRMIIDGSGAIIISKEAEDPSAYFDSIDNDSLETKLTIENDWFECPNVLRAINGDFSAIARDENPDSILSVQNRNREIWIEDSNAMPYAGESLSQYAERMLALQQQVSVKVSYSRRFDPNVNVSDIISLKYPGQGLDGNYYVSSQSISLGYSPTVSEVVYAL